MRNRNMFRLDLVVLLIASISVVGIYSSTNCQGSVPSISVCSDDSVTSNIVYLSGVGAGDNTTDCSCSLSSGSSTNVTITQHQPQYGCQYKFQFIYMPGRWVYSCTQRSMISINTDDSIEINLLPGTENRGGFRVCLQIKTEPDSSVTLLCGKSRWSTTRSSKPDVQTSETESITPSGGESKQTTSTQPTTPKSNQTPPASATIQPASTIESYKPPSPTSKNDNSMSAIIGGSVGGLVVIIVIIIIVICVIRKRRKDKNYKSPEVVESDVHPYQNIPDNRSGEITHQPKQNNELVHQENDPYTSIGNDIIKPSNGNQGMEYLENDLYIGSDDVIDDVMVDDKPKAQLPVLAEYAQVNKSNANKTANGKCKTGPKGDNYAVVNKGGKMINNENEQFKIGPSGDQYAVVTKEGKKNNGEGGTEFKIGPSGDQYAVVNRGGGEYK